MNGWRLLTLFALIIPPAGAHRTDEYLQATRVSIDSDHVDLEIDLTPGVALASKVFSWIDTDRDGQISADEGQRYAQEVLRSVVLKADGWPVQVGLVETSFPSFREMNLGVGTIRLRATAIVPEARAGHHEVAYLNTHHAESSVYLVNALVPSNPRIQLADQRRDAAQHGLTLDYTVAADASSSSGRTFVLLAGLAMAGLFGLRFWFASRRASLVSHSNPH